MAHRLLVTLGGGDPDNITRRVLEAVSSLGHPDLEVVAVVGAANPHRESLQELADASGHRIRLEHDSNHMAELMAWADVAVSAGGSTCWELALMGVPALVMVLADNQRLVAEDLHRRGVVLNLGEAGDITAAGIAVRLEELIGSPEKRAAMSREGRALVDGRGCERVVRCLKAPGFHLRAAEPEDCKLLWQWVNEPTVRQSAFDSREIPWEDHVRWFERALADTHCVIFLAVTPDGTPLGQVRFDLRQNEADCEAEVDVSIAVQMRGQGVGVPMLDLAVDRIFSTTDVHLVKALVRPENEPSLRLFQTCGFVRVGPTLVKGCPAVRFHRERLQ